MYNYMPVTPGVAQGLGAVGIGGGAAANIAGGLTQGIGKGTQFLAGPGALGLAGRYMPALGGVAELATTGDIVSAGGSVAGGIGGAKLGALMGAPLGPVGIGAGALIGSLVGSEGGKKLAKGAQSAITGGVAGAGNLAERTGMIGPYGTQPGLTYQMIAQAGKMNQVQMQNALALNGGMMQQADRFRENELNRSMRAMNQMGMIQGGLAGMKMTGQLADRQLAEGGANFRGAIASANPYANVSTGATVSM